MAGRRRRPARSTIGSAGRSEQFGRRAILAQMSPVHHRDAVAEPEGFLHVMGDHHDGRAEAALDRQQIVLRLGADDRVERAERFVHQQHVRFGGERARDADALLLAAGELMRNAGRRSRGVEIEERPSARRRVWRSAPRSQPSSCGTVAIFCGDGAVREQAMALDDVADAAGAVRRRGNSCDVAAVDADAPLVGSTRRLIMRSRVDLPEPDVPTTTVIAPLSTVSDTSSTTRRSVIALGDVVGSRSCARARR